jgi:hypothetical protein
MMGVARMQHALYATGLTRARMMVNFAHRATKAAQLSQSEDSVVRRCRCLRSAKADRRPSRHTHFSHHSTCALRIRGTQPYQEVNTKKTVGDVQISLDMIGVQV